jgi:hypothetical protein
MIDPAIAANREFSIGEPVLIALKLHRMRPAFPCSACPLWPMFLCESVHVRPEYVIAVFGT